MKRLISIWCTLMLLMIAMSCSSSESDTVPQEAEPVETRGGGDKDTVGLREEVNSLKKKVDRLEKKVNESRSTGIGFGGLLLLLLLGLGYWAYKNGSHARSLLKKADKKFGDFVSGNSSVPSSDPDPASPQPSPQSPPPDPTPGTTVNDKYKQTQTPPAQSTKIPRATPPSARVERSTPALQPQPAKPRPSTTQKEENEEDKTFYAENPVEKMFPPSRVSKHLDTFSLYIIQVNEGGRTASFDLIDDNEIQANVVASQASYGHAIRFQNAPGVSVGQRIQHTEPGTLEKMEEGWRILDRILMELT